MPKELWQEDQPPVNWHIIAKLHSMNSSMEVSL